MGNKRAPAPETAVGSTRLLMPGVSQTRPTPLKTENKNQGTQGPSILGSLNGALGQNPPASVPAPNSGVGLFGAPAKSQPQSSVFSNVAPASTTTTPSSTSSTSTTSTTSTTSPNVGLFGGGSAIQGQPHNAASGVYGNALPSMNTNNAAGAIPPARSPFGSGDNNLFTWKSIPQPQPQQKKSGQYPLSGKCKSSFPIASLLFAS